MNNMITLQHTKIKTSFETSTHVVGHVFKVTLYKRLISMVSRYALNQIAAEFKLVNYVVIDRSRCGCIMRTTYSLSCACKLARYDVGSIPLDTVHMFWQRLRFLDQGLSEPEVCITQEMEAIFKRYKDLDICCKVALRSKLQELAYLDLTSMCAPFENVKTKGAQKKWMTKRQRSTKRDMSYFEYVDALHSVQDSSSTLNGLDHHLNKQNRKGTCQCWIYFIHACRISLKTLLMSKLMVNMDIV